MAQSNDAPQDHPPVGSGPGFAVLYRWRLKPGFEDSFVDAWSRVSQALLRDRGSRGSRLHRGADGIWYGYAQWPSAEARRQAFAAEPVDRDAGEQMAAAVAESFPELVLESVADLLQPPVAASSEPAGGGGSDLTASPHGLLLFAHGARDPRWALPFEAVAARVRARSPTTPLVLAFLEFMQPGLVDAGRQLAEVGCRRVDVLPLFLGAGGHVRKDLPALLDQLRVLHPGVDWRLMPAIGEVDAVVDAMADVALCSLHAG